MVGLGNGEQWLILKASSNNRKLEEPGSRGTVVQLSDLILLQAVGMKGGGADGTTRSSSSAAHMEAHNFADHLLSIHESADGQHPRLLHKDRTGLGLEIWQIELFASQPTPSWFNRPYLRFEAEIWHISEPLFYVFAVEDLFWLQEICVSKALR